MWKYEIWDGGNCLEESDYDFDTQEQAIEYAKEELENRFRYWKIDGCYEGETIDDYDIRTFYDPDCEEE